MYQVLVTTHAGAIVVTQHVWHVVCVTPGHVVHRLHLLHSKSLKALNARGAHDYVQRIRYSFSRLEQVEMEIFNPVGV